MLQSFLRNWKMRRIFGSHHRKEAGIALEEVRMLGTTCWRNGEDDERFVYFYRALADYYEIAGRLQDFQRFCDERLAEPQLRAVRQMIESQLVMA